MTGTIKVTEGETVIRLDNGNVIHARGNAVTVWGPGAVILWQSKTPETLRVALAVAVNPR